MGNWKDTYVFVADCNKRTIVAHPIMPERDGKPIADGPTYGGVSAAQRAEAQCAAAGKPGGGWFEYPFPKPGEERPSRKITYMLAVPGTPYVVGAGVYGETVTLERAGGAQRRAALTRPRSPGGEAARPRRACRAHASGSPCKGTSAASASASGAGGGCLATKQPRRRSRVQRIDKSRSDAEPAGGGSRDGTKREAGAARGPRPALPPQL